MENETSEVFIIGKNYNEKSDAILKYLRSRITYWVPLLEIANSYKGVDIYGIKAIVETAEFEILYDKLDYDAYARYNKNRDCLSITASGVLFIDKGGYTKQVNDLKGKEIREIIVSVALFIFAFFGAIASIITICEKICNCGIYHN